MASEASIPVVVVYSPGPRKVSEVPLQVPVGCTVAQAIEASALLTEMTAAQVASTAVGIWGRKASWGQVLRANDRVELYRPLKVDPKVARRERFVGQGAKTAGLFAKRRAGAKAGY
jgi:putative ubiquitin-RnfH superfamily antitoxin RatB of RatAB toxin-antitoxin module